MRKFTLLTALFCISALAYGQNMDEEAIKKTIQDEAKAIASRDLGAWKAAWLHDPQAFQAFYARNFHNSIKSWDSLEAVVDRDYKQNPKPDILDYKVDNFTIRSNGAIAWVEYDAVITPVDRQPAMFPYTDLRRFHNYAMLVKENEEWKFASRILTMPETYQGNDDHAIESELNATGYQLLAAKKYNEAIEVFKLNVKLYPESFNTYDSLGEAYAIAGNKKQAIENYEKSLKLNPKSTSGQEALARLKKK